MEDNPLPMPKQTPMFKDATLRDWFAGMALQGLNANPDISKHAAEKGYQPSKVRQDYARTAYEQADCMLTERAKKK